MPGDAPEGIRDLLDRVELFSRVSDSGRRRLAGALRECSLEQGEVLFRHGDSGASLYVVADGALEVAVQGVAGQERVLAHIDRDQCVGEMALMASNARRTATVKAVTPARLLELSKEEFDHLLAAEPSMRQLIGRMLRHRLPGLHVATSRLFGDLDEGLLEELQSHFYWVSLKRDEDLFREGEPAEAVYYVVNGRIQVSVAEGGERRLLEQVGGGEVVGEIGMVTGDPHGVTARALRDSDLIGLSRQGFEQILERKPKAAVYVVRAMLRELRSRDAAGVALRDTPARTIAVLPLEPGLAGFGRTLARALSPLGKTLYLDARTFDRFHNPGAAQLDDDDPRALFIRKWFSQHEESRAHVVFEADPEDSAWTRRCIRQADRILLAAPAGAGTALREVERVAQGLATGVPRELVLVHPQGTTLPRDTGAWLAPRTVAAHHHLRQGEARDMGRLARFLTGRSVGLVLGAGGARGLANIGVLRALREFDIPVDYIGGASMGGFLAALVAADFDDAAIVRFVRRVLVDKPRGFGYTLPLVSMMSVRNSEERFREIFGESHIEDLWLNLFCVSVNITNPGLKVHQEGRVWRAVRASLAIPGLIAPLFEKGELLVDGALLDSVPVDVMARLNPGPVVASDVSKAPALAVDPALDSCPSPGRLLWERIAPGSGRPEVPRMGSILMRCMDVSANLNKRENRDLAALYLVPPVGQYRILDFDRMEAFIARGYEYTREVLAEADLSRLRFP